MNTKVDNYHRGRQIFITDKGELILSETNTSYSHKDFMTIELKKSEAEIEDIMNNTLRGYIDETGNIYFYRGYDFSFDKSDVTTAMEIIQELNKRTTLDPKGSVFGGVIAGEPGTKWPPKIIIGKIRDII